MGDVINNERLKLLANALDRVSTACVTVGAITPLATLVFGLEALSIPPHWAAAGAFSWLLAATALHLFARATLGGLIDDRI